MTKKKFLNTFDGYKNKWYRYALTLLSDPLESEDAVQELYLKLWRMRNNLQKYNSLEALSFRMLKNLCIDR